MLLLIIIVFTLSKLYIIIYFIKYKNNILERSTIITRIDYINIFFISQFFKLNKKYTILEIYTINIIVIIILF